MYFRFHMWKPSFLSMELLTLQGHVHYLIITSSMNFKCLWNVSSFFPSFFLSKIIPILDNSFNQSLKGFHWKSILWFGLTYFLGSKENQVKSNVFTQNTLASKGANEKRLTSWMHQHWDLRHLIPHAFTILACN